MPLKDSTTYHITGRPEDEVWMSVSMNVAFARKTKENVEHSGIRIFEEKVTRVELGPEHTEKGLAWRVSKAKLKEVAEQDVPVVEISEQEFKRAEYRDEGVGLKGRGRDRRREGHPGRS